MEKSYLRRDIFMFPLTMLSRCLKSGIEWHFLLKVPWPWSKANAIHTHTHLHLCAVYNWCHGFEHPFCIPKRVPGGAICSQQYRPICTLGRSAPGDSKRRLMFEGMHLEEQYQLGDQQPETSPAHNTFPKQERSPRCLSLAWGINHNFVALFSRMAHAVTGSNRHRH